MNLKTRFSNFIDREHPLQEYPRPLLRRNSYFNLNGYWDYAITETNEFPSHYDGKILVPFSPECSLSEVNRQLKPEQFLWYHCILTDPRAKPSECILLQFGAIDQTAEIYLNQNYIASHQGGYLPFSVDLTEAFLPGENSLLLKVTDVSDTSYHARGKQKLESSGMFYTAQSGIWQTVFMECVPQTYIKSLTITPNFDENSVTFSLVTNQNETLPSSQEQNKGLGNALGKITILKQGALVNGMEHWKEEDRILCVTIKDSNPLTLSLPLMSSWTPEHPYLYDVLLELGEDVVQSYFAMRKISIDYDKNNIPRILLNNQPYFQNGLLDQGYWPESLYTPPSDEAMIYDISIAKELGFNLLRKHAKIEPSRWYYHCDRLGMLVWQDFVNGGSSYRTWFVTLFPTLLPRVSMKIKDSSYSLFSRSDELGKEEYLSEMEQTVASLYNHPSIVLWVPFNEGWGQFDSIKITDKLSALDSTRLIDSASGWFDQGCGDVKSLHIYFTPMHFNASNRALVLSEFGGYTLRIPSHTFNDATYGYRYYKSRDSLTNAIVSVYKNKIIPGIEKGLCATVYTQLTDIEEEINGLMTYDREILKVDQKQIIEMNQHCTIPK